MMNILGEKDAKSVCENRPLLLKILAFVLAVAMLLAVVIFVVFHFHHHRRGDGAAANTTAACDFFQGRWVMDESYPMYDSSICPFVEKEFNCLRNGRPDHTYLKYRWKPLGCDIARFDGHYFLDRYRGKNILFAGDSLTRDQYMSFVCLLYTTVPGTNYNLTRVDKVSTLIFKDYGIKVTLDRNAFLVDLVPSKKGTSVLRLDSVARSEKLWLNNDMLVFNTWHWWTYRGALQVWKYIQIGEKRLKDMDRLVAFETALRTWANWVDRNVDPAKSVVFFQGVSPSHYRGGEWNQPNMTNCAGVTQLFSGSTFPAGEPTGLAVQKRVVSGMKVPVKFLDITALSQMRIDAHPSYYGTQAAGGADCTHWCVAGVPDTWNELLYNLLLKEKDN